MKPSIGFRILEVVAFRTPFDSLRRNHRIPASGIFLCWLNFDHSLKLLYFTRNLIKVKLNSIVNYEYPTSVYLSLQVHQAVTSQAEALHYGCLDPNSQYFIADDLFATCPLTNGCL